MGVMMSEGGNRLLRMDLLKRLLLDMLCRMEAVDNSASIDERMNTRGCWRETDKQTLQRCIAIEYRSLTIPVRSSSFLVPP